MKTKTIAIIVEILAFLSIAALAAYLFKDKLKNLFHPAPAPAPDQPVVPAKDTTTKAVIHDMPRPRITPTVDFWSLDKSIELRKGSNGNEVVQLQTMINQALTLKKMPLIPNDGGFGSKTEAALKYLTGKTRITLAQASTLFVAAMTK